jgi:hypothetical protein
MNFGDLINNVIVRTKRSDKVDVIAQSINKAVVEFCRMKKFGKDLAYEQWAVPAPDQGNRLLHIEWSEIAYDVRAFELIRGINDSCGLDRIASNQTLMRGKVVEGTYYESGAGIHLSLRVPTDVIILSYYYLPPRLVAASDEHWVSRAISEELIERAAAILFRTVGEDREADRIMQLSMLAYERASRDLT